MGGVLLCPSGQENLTLGLRYGKAEAIGGRYKRKTFHVTSHCAFLSQTPSIF